MGLGCIMLIGEGQGDAALRSLLGAPVAIRTLAAALIPSEEIVVALVGPSATHAPLRQEAARFGLSELKHLLEGSGNARTDLRRAVETLGKDADTVLVVDGLQALTPSALVVNVVKQAREHGAAACALPASGVAFVDEAKLGTLATDAVCLAVLPAAFKRDVLEKALAVEGDNVLVLAARAGLALERVGGDRDAFPLVEEADLNRALEIWGRRAPEYAFIWPRPGSDDEEESTQVRNIPDVNITIPDAAGREPTGA